MSGAVYAATLSRAMWQRSLNEILRVRGALLPTTVAPMIFLLGTTGQFGRLADLVGLPDDLLPRVDPAAVAACRARASPAARPAPTSRATSSRAGSTGC